NAAARSRDANHFPGDVKRFGRKHGAEYRESQIKIIVNDVLQVGRIAFLKSQVAQSQSDGSFVPGLNKISGDIDSKDSSTQASQRNCRRAIAATEIQNFHLWRYTKRLRDYLSRLTHESGNLRKVTFFPQRFVWIVYHVVLRDLSYGLQLCGGLSDSSMPGRLDVLLGRPAAVDSFARWPANFAESPAKRKRDSAQPQVK